MRPALVILPTALWNVLGVLVLTIGPLRAQETQASDLWKALENATDAAGLAAVAPRIDAFLKANPKDQSAPFLMGHLGERWRDAGRDDDALAAFDRLAKEYGTTHLAYAHLGSAATYERRGDAAKTIAAYEKAIAAPAIDTRRSLMDGDNTRNMAYCYLAYFHERRGEFEQALAVWERYPPSSWCGHCAATYERERLRGIARGQLRLGDAKAAVATIENSLSGKLSAALVYAEAAARAGSLEHAREVVAGLPEDERAVYSIPMEMAAAWVAKKPDEIIGAVGKADEPDASLDALAAGFISELGAAGTEALTRGIRGGDAAAIRLAPLVREAASRPTWRPASRSLSRPASRSVK